MNTFSDWEDDNEPLHACVMFINKCFLHGIPSKSDYTLMVIHGEFGKLAFFRPGLKSWITVTLWNSHCSDIIYYNEQFYAIDVSGRIVVIDIKSDNTHLAHQVANMPQTHLKQGLDKVYLVEIDGILLVVIRNRKEEVTFSFEVLQVELSTNTWTEVHSLGNKTLFLGDNSSLAIETLELSGCKSNCIYFTEDYTDEYYGTEKGGGKDMGIYHLEDGRIEPHFNGDSCYLFTPPLWVEKSF
ncbi:hypothetical protein QYF36_018681 [Acer negundo]|nr:hypothetical protein QYF36_018681 [Acer negundo]